MPSLSARRAARGNPVYDRGRLGRFVGGLVDYVRTAWWGLISPRTHERRPLVIAQAVVLREGLAGPEVLLTVRSDLFGWELPGGTLERGERPADALLREVLEETGLEVEIERTIGDWTRTGFRPHTAHLFRCRVAGGMERPSHETPRIAWFPATEPPEALFPWYREPLAVALEIGDENVSVREHQGIDSIWTAMKIDLAMRWRGLPSLSETSSDQEPSRSADRK